MSKVLIIVVSNINMFSLQPILNEPMGKSVWVVCVVFLCIPYSRISIMKKDIVFNCFNNLFSCYLYVSCYHDKNCCLWYLTLVFCVLGPRCGLGNLMVRFQWQIWKPEKKATQRLTVRVQGTRMFSASSLMSLTN